MNYLRSCSVLLGCPLMLVAQTQYGGPPIQSRLVSPVYGRSVVAHLSGHQLPDVVMLANGTLDQVHVQTAVQITAPGVHGSVAVLPGVAGKAIRDVAVIPQGDPVRRRDALALVTDAGLFRWVAGGATTRFGGSVWNSASRVAVGDVDGDGHADAIGVMANGQNVRRQALGGTGATWFVDTGSAIQDLLVTDWCANASGVADDVVVAQADRIVFVVDGAIQGAATIFLQVHSASHLAVIDDGAGGRRLVVAYSTDSGWYLTSFGSNGSGTAPQPLSGVAGLTRVDRGSGPDGVVVTWTNGAAPTEYVYDGALPGFGAGTNLRMQLGTNVATARAHRCDLDADGDLDDVAMSDTAGLLREMNGGAAGGVTVSGSGSDLGTYTVGGSAPAGWSGHVEVIFFQIDRVVDAEQGLVGLSLDVAARGRKVVANGASPFPEASVSLQDGPIVTVLRHVDVQGGVVVQRGAARPVLWTLDNEERELLSTLLLGEQVQFPNATFPSYGGVGGTVDPPVIPPPEPDQDPPDGGEPGGG